MKRFLLVFLTVLLPAYLVTPIQAQQDDSPITPPSLQVSNGGLHTLPLKAIQDSDGEIDTQEDFEIQPGDIITVGQSSDFHVLPNGGAIDAVKITDDALQTTDLVFSESTGRVSQTLAPKAYLLDVIVLMENDDRYLYETVMAVLAPGQTLQQVNVQNIIQNFVSTRSDTHTTVVFQDDNEPPDEEEPSICYFEPNTAPECKPLPDGSCPNDFVHNDDGNCHPGGQCPDGFGRVDDDETGTCYPDDETIECDNGAIVLREEDCAIYDPNPPAEPAPSNDTSAEEPEPITCEEGFVLENGRCAALDSNCGGIPCTASDKEDSTTSDPVPGEPDTESEEVVEDIEEQEEESGEEETDSNDNDENGNDSNDEEN